MVLQHENISDILQKTVRKLLRTGIFGIAIKADIPFTKGVCEKI